MRWPASPTTTTVPARSWRRPRPRSWSVTASSTFDPPSGAFLVARRVDAAGPPLGGVGLRAIHPGVGQIRRLWVDPGWRGQGLARALMAGIEDAARELGLTDLRLGTGDRQPEAVALYESSGWERVLVGNDGRPVPPRHVWFLKQLGPKP
jgi:GNAT superfamily N-acetyltransferase